MGKKEKSKLGIIGIVLLAIIVFIIASITYSYVESIRIRPIDEIDEYIQGYVVSVAYNDTIEFQGNEYPLYHVTINTTEDTMIMYPMFFYDLYPPLDQISLRLFYDTVSLSENTYYRIVRVEMI